MEILWAGRTEKPSDQTAEYFNSSLRFDKRMYKEDLLGSLAHAAMLGAKGIIPQKDADAIAEGLGSILGDLESGKLSIPEGYEDIHTFVEAELTARIGEPGKMLHTARSRNDQVATDLRLYMKTQCAEVKKLLVALVDAVLSQAEKEKSAVAPGYTHLQRAQPVTMGHHLLAYAMMFLRDLGRLSDAVKRVDFSPLGCCALAGTTYPIDRGMTAKALGFSGVCANSIDGVSDRDWAAELLFVFSLVMTHLSRFSEEIILWTSWEFRFAELDDSFTTGSSIMPQKKNSDMAELVRGKTGRVYGDLTALLTVLKGLPLAYNKDLQEDKEALFDALDTVKICLEVFAPMIASMKFLDENMYKAAEKGFINATDLADYLTKKGLPFRTAYKLVGQTVAYCLKSGNTLSDLPLCEYKKLYDGFEDDLYEAIALENCVKNRCFEGGTSPSSVEAQIALAAGELEKYRG